MVVTGKEVMKWKWEVDKVKNWWLIFRSKRMVEKGAK